MKDFPYLNLFVEPKLIHSAFPKFSYIKYYGIELKFSLFVSNYQGAFLSCHIGF
jgi:hypothetical protein